MADKDEQVDKPRERSDAERRARQCARLANLMRTLHLISGRGRWDAKALAEELECSQRTVHRILATLSMAGVPWYFDEKIRAYRVRTGFKFPLVEQANTEEASEQVDECETDQLAVVVSKVIEDGEAFAATLRAFLDELKLATNPDAGSR